MRAWIGRQLGSDIDRVRRLPGASSTAVHLLALVDGHRVVLRRCVRAEAPGLLATVVPF